MAHSMVCPKCKKHNVAVMDDDATVKKSLRRKARSRCFDGRGISVGYRCEEESRRL